MPRFVLCWDVGYTELPNVESPSVARFWFESNPSCTNVDPLDGFGLTDPSHASEDEHLVRRRWVEEIESGRRVLVKDGPADDPAVRQVGDEWRPTSHPLNPEAEHNFQHMIEQAMKNRLWHMPVSAVKKEDQPSPVKTEKEPEELTVTNPRWEHVDDQRRKDSPDTTTIRDKITLKVDVTGVHNGTVVHFKVFDTARQPPALAGRARGKVTDGVATAEWKVRGIDEHPKLQFEGSTRGVTSDRAEIPVVTEGLLPIIPMVYSSPTLDRATAVHLPGGSYLYIFRDGKLYRELAVEKKENSSRPLLKEIDLERLRKKYDGILPDSHARKPTGGSGTDFAWVPYNGTAENNPLIQIAVSMEQWGGQYIKALEGDTQKRDERTQTLDYKGAGSGFGGSSNLLDIDQAAHPQELQVVDETYHLDWFEEYEGTGTALAYLQDPVWLAVQLSKQTEVAVKKLTELVTEAREHPHYNSAAIAYPLLFSDKLKNERSDWVPDWIEDRMDAQLQARDATDLEKLNQVLRIDEREKLRSDIRECNETLVGWLEQEESKQLGSDFIPFNVGIRDPFSLPSIEYGKGFLTVAAIFKRSCLGNYPDDIDGPLTLPEVREKERKEEDPGLRYLRKLVEDTGYPLHKMLFATEEQVPVYSDDKPAANLVKIDGSGMFRPHALDPEGFAELLVEEGVSLEKIEESEFSVPAITSPEGQVYRRVAEFSSAAVGEFSGHYTKQLIRWQADHAKALKAVATAKEAKDAAEQTLRAEQKSAFKASRTTSEPIALFARGAKAAHLKAFSSMQISFEADAIPPGKVPIGLKWVNSKASSKGGRNVFDLYAGDELAYSSDPSKFGETFKPWSKQGRWHKGPPPEARLKSNAVLVLVDADVLPYLDPNDYKVDVPLDLDENSLRQHGPEHSASRRLQKKISNADFAAKQVDEADRKATEIGEQEALARQAGVKADKIAQFGKGVTVIAALFNLWNTLGAFEAYKAEGGDQKAKELESAGLDLVYAVGEAVNELSKARAAAVGILEQTVARQVMFRLFGGYTSIVSYELAVAGFFQELEQGDSDAAMGQLSMAVGFGLLAVSMGAQAAGSAATALGFATSISWAGPVGLLGAGLILAGAAIYVLYNDSELERWAKNGPFARDDSDTDPDLAWLKDGGKPGNPDGFPAFEHLMGVLFTPTLEIRHQPRQGINGEITPNEFVVRVGLPVMFATAKVELHCEVDVSVEKLGGNSESHCKSIQPTLIQDDSEKKGSPTRDFLFNGIPDPIIRHSSIRRNRHEQSNIREMECIYRIKARILTGRHNLTFPVVPRTGQGTRILRRGEMLTEYNGSGKGNIDFTKTGWIYAATVFRANDWKASWDERDSNILP